MWFCRHEWKVITETVTKSFFETLAEKMPNLTKVKISDSMSGRKHIQSFQCTKCGKFKRYVENI